MFTYKTDAQLETMTSAERDTYANEKRVFEEQKTQDAIKEAVEKELTIAKEELKNKITSQETEINSLKEIVNLQGKEISAKSILLEKNVDELELEIAKHSKEIEASTSKGREHTFEIKADVLKPSVSNNPFSVISPEIGQLAHRKIMVYDLFRKITLPANANGVYKYVDWDQATSVRAAAAIAENGVFPQSTATWIGETLDIRKVGDMIPFSEELAYDSKMFADELKNFLNTNVAIKVDDDLINANGTAPNINGMLSIVPAFTPVNSGITDASIYDLLVKLNETISKPYGAKYRVNVALMNITDINKMKLKKDSQNNYILPPFYNQNGNIVDGITVLECNALTANTMIVGDSRYGAIIEAPSIAVEVGYATGDFESDMMTLKAKKRLNLLIRRVDRTGWLKVTSISAALTTLATT